MKFNMRTLIVLMLLILCTIK